MVKNLFAKNLDSGLGSWSRTFWRSTLFNACILLWRTCLDRETVVQTDWLGVKVIPQKSHGQHGRPPSYSPKQIPYLRAFLICHLCGMILISEKLAKRTRWKHIFTNENQHLLKNVSDIRAAIYPLDSCTCLWTWKKLELIKRQATPWPVNHRKETENNMLKTSFPKNSEMILKFIDSHHIFLASVYKILLTSQYDSELKDYQIPTTKTRWPLIITLSWLYMM